MSNTINLILKDETYKLRGILFEVHNRLGSSQKEQAYANALEIIFKKLNIPYEREKKIPLNFEGENIGELFVDFVVWNKIGLELKAKRMLSRDDFRQALRYIEVLNLPLILLVNFRSSKKLFIKRIINSKYIKNTRIKHWYSLMDSNA